MNFYGWALLRGFRGKRLLLRHARLSFVDGTATVNPNDVNLNAQWPFPEGAFLVLTRCCISAFSAR